MTEAVKIQDQRLATTRRVTLVGAVINLLLAVVKMLFGWLANSQALLVDGIHSLSDLLSDALVWFAAQHAAQAPDADHPYGHGRFETLATLGLGVLLTLVALGIIWDAASRLFAPERLLQPGVLALVVAMASILAKEWLYHYTQKRARRIKSEMLRANAWHHRSDAVSSVVVLVGVGGTMAGLSYLDAIAAIGVGLMIAHIGWELGRPAMQELVDAGLEEERLAQIRETIESVPGVIAIHMLRTRRSGAQASADVHVLVDPWLSVSEGHMISQMVTDQLLEQIEELSDVTVHIDPEDDEIAAPSKGLPMRDEAERMLKDSWQDLPGLEKPQRILLHYLAGRINVDLYFPLSCFQGEQEARRLESQLKERARPLKEFGQLKVYYG